MNKVIIPTGYMGSGSSAITDLMQEFDSYEASKGTFEYVFLHCPNGVFDLEDKLLVGNNALRSDEAIHSFWNTMNELYNSRLWWVGNYKKNLHKDFLDITQEYLNELIIFRPKDYWYMQQKGTFDRLIRLVIRKMVMLISFNKIVLKVPLNYEPMTIAIPVDNEFYEITQKYIYKLFDCMGIGEKNLVLDQLLLPFNLFRMEKYFKDNVECFVVERDPRDIFILNKYIWGMRDQNPVPYPTEVLEFCNYYKRLRSLEKMCDNEHIHRIKFEDMIYNYDVIVKDILNILGLNEKQHIYKKKFFDPNKSINNTQLFLDKKYKEEVDIIEEKLKAFLYDFPYRAEINIEKSF